jgi:CelD/BcsL family acetyltransferase involved in cellulose biosynthesis
MILMSYSALSRQSRLLKTEVFETVAEFDAFENDWNDLLEDSNQAVFFLRWNWNRLWWQAYAPGKGRPYLVVCRDSNERVVGLAPLYWREYQGLREVLFLGTGISITTSEHLDLISRRGYEQAVGQSIAARILTDPEVGRVLLGEIPITSTVLPHFRRAMSGQQRIQICNRSHYIDTSVDWNAFNASLSKSMRTNLSYYTRKLFKTHKCHFRTVEAEDELTPAMHSLVRLHQARWSSKGERGAFGLPGVENFLREVMQASLGEGRLKLWTLELDGQTAAVLLAFVNNGVANYFQGGFDPTFAKESLGTVMCGLCIRACIESPDINEFNFMGGDPSYKERWTRSSRDSVMFEWLRPGIRSLLYRIGEQGENASKSFFRLVTPTTIRETIQAFRRKRLQEK